MPKELGEDDIEEILDEFAECDTLTEVEDELDYHYNTIRKYVKEAYEEGDDRASHYGKMEQEEEPEEWEGAGPGESPFGKEDEVDLERDYAGLSPGEFIEEFFEDFEVGVKKKWVRIQARRADRRDMIPTKDSLKKDILRMKSGINQSAHVEADYIAEEYWAEAQEYLNMTGRQADQVSMSGRHQGQQQQGYGQGQPMQQGGQGFVSPGMGQQQQPQMDPQMQMMQMMMEQMKEMNKELQKVRQQPERTRDDVDTLGRLKELREEKEILEDLSGGDEQLEQVQRQIQQLQQQAIEDNAAQAPMARGGDTSLEDRLLDLAMNSPDVSPREVIDVIEERQAAMQDPEILDKELERDIREMELEQKQERYERFGDLAETIASRVGEGIGAQITNGGGDAEPSADDDQHEEIVADGNPQAESTLDGGELPQTAQPMTQEQECKHCGAIMEVGPNAAHCPECEYGIGPCDLCHFPVEIPPAGEAEFSRCGECENVLPVPDDPDDEVECDECGWEGEGDELRGEVLECGNCNSFRPIQRRIDPEAQQEQLENLMEE